MELYEAVGIGDGFKQFWIDCWLLGCCFLNLALLLLNQTCTRASDNLVFWAKSSRTNTSGYWLMLNALSNSSNCSAVKVVLDRLCLRLSVIPGSESQSESSPLRAEKYEK